MTKPYLSACIMCLNEERVLHRCLGSLKGVVDEIVFVDTGSTDRSIEIATEHGAVISHFTWCDDFSAARNQTIQRANGRWVLIIDCDEHLEGALAAPGALKAEIHRLEEEHGDAWPRLFVKLPVIDKDINETTANGMTKQLRIFPRHEQVYYESPIHNRLVLGSELRGVAARALELSADDLQIVHRGYDPAVWKSKNKSDRAFRLLKKAIADRPDALNHFYLGREHAHIEQWSEGFDALSVARRMLIEPGHELEQHHLLSTYHYLAVCAHGMKKPLEETRAILVEALDRFPLSPDLWHEAGSIFFDNEQYEGAKNAFVRAEEVLPHAIENETSFLIHRPWVLYFNQFKTFAALRDDNSARIALEKAIAIGMPEAEAAQDILDAKPVNGRVRAGVASVPARENTLEAVVRSVISQVDELFVYLNHYTHIPAFLDDPRIHVFRSQEHGDLRDTGKFWGLEQPGDFDYYFSLDDDILYPPNYVCRLVDEIEACGRRAVIGVHGSRMKPPVQSYIRDREVRHCLAELAGRESVDVIGTGTAAFHVSTLQPRLADFKVHGMTDIWLSRCAEERSVPRIAIPRRQGWLLVFNIETGTLFEEAAVNDSIQTEAVQPLVGSFAFHSPNGQKSSDDARNKNTDREGATAHPHA